MKTCKKNKINNNQTGSNTSLRQKEAFFTFVAPIVLNANDNIQLELESFNLRQI